MQFSIALLTGILLGGPEIEVTLDRPVPLRLAGGRFDAELNSGLTASWKNVPLRPVLRRIEDERQISILLDRRIDPLREIAIDFAGVPLRTALQQFAARAGAEVRAVGNAVYIGPAAAAANLRTLVELRRDELESSATARRRFELSRRRTIHWNDLERPAEILSRIASRYDLSVAGLEQIPHDLWAGATLPEMTAGEALSLVLIQFDLTFAWADRGAGIQIVPAPEQVQLERRYQPRGVSAATAAARWREEIPGLVAEVSGREVVVRGTAEQHEAVAERVQPGRRSIPPRVGDRPTPIERRQFSLRIDRVPASALMRKLEESGIVFQYDATALAEAGIDLEQPISLDIREARADEFFRAVFEPLELRHSIDGLTVTLVPGC